MTAIWGNAGGQWRLLAPSGFPDEAALHGLVENAPHILPLAGAPQLAVVGREVRIGPNLADLVAIEPGGRVVIIEVKLRSNPESRRAIIAQILTYAAYLRGSEVGTLEGSILRSHLERRGWRSLAEAASAAAPDSASDAGAFNAALAESLATGRFRLVLVLDEAPEELVRLVGYLEAVADKLVIDLVTVASYRVGDSQVLVPQRVEPERVITAPVSGSVSTTPLPAQQRGYDADIRDYRGSIAELPEGLQPQLSRLVDWAEGLQRDGLAALVARRDSQRWWYLRIHVPGDASLVVLSHGPNSFNVAPYRGVFTRRAPNSLRELDEQLGSDAVTAGGKGIRVDEQVLGVLTEAYREAASGRITLPSTPE